MNRFDGLIVFVPLTLDDVSRIAQLMLKGVAARVEEKGMALRVEDAALKELAVLGYDPKFGARPLRRVIQERVEDPLATLLLEQKVGRRDTVVLDAGGVMRVEKAHPDILNVSLQVFDDGRLTDAVGRSAQNSHKTYSALGRSCHFLFRCLDNGARTVEIRRTHGW
ncbi:hypothetical protein HYV72_01255 [Candidatus Uhrbacteria bacterium]|nr:hypothetical protein [Candidatus Uhrbacteria bacterium]